MTQRTEAEIRAGIERLRRENPQFTGSTNSVDAFAHISALEWVLSASPEPVAGDDEIVEAMARAMCCGKSCGRADGRITDSWPCQRSVFEPKASVALFTARPLIERAARASADAEIAELRASLAKAEEALEPFASFGISDDGTLSPTDLIRDRICDWFGPSDFAAAAAALSNLRKARGEAQ